MKLMLENIILLKNQLKYISNLSISLSDLFLRFVTKILRATLRGDCVNTEWPCVIKMIFMFE